MTMESMEYGIPTRVKPVRFRQLSIGRDRLRRLQRRPAIGLQCVVRLRDCALRFFGLLFGCADYFAVMPVQPGHEGRISQLLQAEQKNYVFLLPLENMEQHRQITLSRSHFFVLRQGERLRFYKGGEAGK